jgi:uncharacterized membrane protein YqhA
LGAFDRIKQVAGCTAPRCLRRPLLGAGLRSSSSHERSLASAFQHAKRDSDRRYAREVEHQQARVICRYVRGINVMEADQRPLLGADANQETAFFRGIGIVVRFIMLAPALATFVLAVALLVEGLADTWQSVQSVVGMTNGHDHQLVLRALEIVDTFLVAMVVLVTAIGIYQLFINRRIPVPEWLRIYDIDDLKAKLIGVVITVLGVYFLGKALAWDYGKDILPLGLSVAAVALALSYFLSIHFRRDPERSLGHATDGTQDQAIRAPSETVAENNARIAREQG